MTPPDSKDLGVPEEAVEAAVMVQERQSVRSPTVRAEMRAILQAALPAIREHDRLQRVQGKIDDRQAIRTAAVEAERERLKEAFNRIGGLPDPTESREDFAERVEAGDAVRIAFDIAAALTQTSVDNQGEER